MELGLLLEMAASADGGRVLVGPRENGLTAGDLRSRAQRGARLIRAAGVAHVVYVGVNGPAFPVALFAAAAAGVPLVPLNYRLPVEQLTHLAVQNSPALLIADEGVVLTEGVVLNWTPQEWLARTAEKGSESEPDEAAVDADAIALLLYTSGTTAEPKAAVLRYRHLTAYVLSTIEFASAAQHEATLVSVPPYHIAGVANAITNIYAGRRVVYLSSFAPEDWLRTVRTEGITHALVVPTMLARIVEHLGAAGAEVPTLRSLAYGGAPMPRSVIERALALFPDTGFVNAYGLTETSSTIALLGPDDHRLATAASDEAVRARLYSVGRAVPGIELQIRAVDGTTVCPPGVPGQLWVRGEQVAGEYRDAHSGGTEDWFCTRDQARLDADGFLFIDGRVDDTIIRAGENIAPAEIEEVLLQHPGVADVAVVGVPDAEWGQKIAAVLVARAGYELELDDIQAWARHRLRTSKTPQLLFQADDLPRTDTGKLVRRQVVAELIN